MEVEGLAISGQGASCLGWLLPICEHPPLLNHSPGKPQVVFGEQETHVNLVKLQ